MSGWEFVALLVTGVIALALSHAGCDWLGIGIYGSVCCLVGFRWGARS